MDTNHNPDPFGDDKKRERNHRILEMRKEGESLRHIANAVGVSHETVALVCRKNGLGRVVLSQARSLSTEERQQIVAAWVGGEHYRDIAEARNLYIATVKRVVEDTATPRDKEARRLVTYKRRGNHGQHISDADIIFAVRECGDSLGGKRPTTNEYREWAAENGRPSIALVQKRLTWRKALEGAGFEPITKKGRGPRWTTEECWAAAQRARDILGHAPSIGEYEETLGHLPDYPGAQTLRWRCGGWQTIVSTLHQESVENEAERREWSEADGDHEKMAALAVAKTKSKRWWKS